MFVGQDERLYRGSGLVRRVRVWMTSIGDKVTDWDVGRIIQVPKALVGIREPFSRKYLGCIDDREENEEVYLIALCTIVTAMEPSLSFFLSSCT